MAATKSRIAVGKIILHREGQRVIVNDGQKFDFTVEELESLKATNPNAVRTPINEDESAVEVKVPAPAPQPKSGKQKGGGDKGNGGGESSDSKPEGGEEL